MPLRGIDVSSWQAGIDVESVPCDFVIVKATGGTGYSNPDFRRASDATLRAGKKLGIYHYAREEGCMGSAAEEARHFLDAFMPYKGKAIPVLDWEASAVDLPTSWAKEWLDTVARETGAKPWFYSYSSAVNSHDYSSISNYPLWIAAYFDGYEPMGYLDNPPLYGGTGAWSYPTAYQYTSTGRIGYSGNLDLNIFYGDGEDWDAMCGKGKRRKEIRIDCANVAATIHADMCNDDANGYSWSPRHGEDGLGVKKLVIDGREYSYDRGSWDCSSSVIKAWQEALRYTEHEGALDGATYTGNMRSVFSRSGLFDVWDTSSTSAVRGDVYLNDQYHTAMCQDGGNDGVLGYDALSEFCINEHGGAYGGKPGDRTGREAYVHGFYDRPWDCTLHYNGKADVIGYEEEVDDLKEVTNIGGDVFRLYKEGRHMLTTSEAERNELEKRGWKYEGVAFTAPKGGVAPVYRMAKGGDHVFTCSFEEAKTLQEKDWEYEGVPFFGAENGKAVYRLYKDNRHLFTADKREYDELKKRGWTQEGVAWRC